MVDKEQWEKLSDEDKSYVIGEFCEKLGLGKDFDYAKAREYHDRVQESYRQARLTNNTMSYENPVLVLKLIDPILADMILAWMYTKVELPNGKKTEVPFLGYNLIEFVFDKSSLMNYNSEEKEVLRDAIRILKNKGGI
jgi:hypothetical protein|nr:MAG: hypothetical protein [Bacteriophage sp.]